MAEEERKQACPRHQSNGLALSPPGGLIKGGSLGTVSAIGPSVNTYLANASSKWPAAAFGTLRRLHDVVLHMVFLLCNFFLPFHLYKLFYDEGGDAEGIGAGGRVRISQDPARGIFSSPEGAWPHILEHRREQEAWKLSGLAGPVADKLQLC